MRRGALVFNGALFDGRQSSLAASDLPQSLLAFLDRC